MAALREGRLSRFALNTLYELITDPLILCNPNGHYIEYFGFVTDLKRSVLSGNYDAYYNGYFVSKDVTNYNKWAG